MSGQVKTISPGMIIQLVLLVLVVPFLPLLISGQWGWWEAWVYAVIYIMGFVVSRALARHRHPDLIAERARFMEHEDTKPWDKTLAPLVGMGGGLIPLVAGLEARLDWASRFSLGVEIAALVAMLVGYGVATYSLVENRFFSGTVRIQAERDHAVVSSGPYQWMRHPGYAGGLLTYLVTPLFLDSWWAFLPAVVITILVVFRTHLEDRMLQEELEGYRQYAERVRYRLLPGLW